MRFTTALTLLLATGAQAIPKITRSGRYLYDESGSRFYLRGIAYQEQGSVVVSEDNPFGEPSDFVDPLALPDACARDLPFLQQLGINAVRVYSVNASLNHDGCMKTFSDAGIYTIIDLSLPINGSIDRLAPSWSVNILDQYTRTIDAFSAYPNAVLSYNVGNEVATREATSGAPYVKAAARDTKAYLKSINSASLVGYASIDGPTEFRNAFSDYLVCDPAGGGSGDTSVDIFGFNSYGWCGDSNFETAFAGPNQDFQDLPVPAYFSEYGCKPSDQPRPWSEVPVLFGPQMTDIWSGGVAFSYFPAQSAAGQFGLVTVDGNTVTTGQDFENLKTRYTAVSFTNSPAQGSASSSFPACPQGNAAFTVSNTLPPTPNANACSCLDKAASCQFRPATPDFTTTVGELINYACSTLLPGRGANCDDIGGNGTTGTYGRLSGCDPSVKLSYLMSQWYELSNKDAQACSFSGNGTVNSASTSGAQAAASSCISNPAAVFTPSGAPGSSASSPAGSGSGGNSNSNNNGAIQPVVAISALVFIALASAISTLA